MFKYKVKCIGWKFHLLRKKATFDFWKKTGLVYNTKASAEIVCKRMNGGN